MIRDRQDAGQRLAERLARYGGDAPLVLALPRGGVPVAAEIARALDAALDVVLVRKIGAPGQPELAIGAITDGKAVHIALNDSLIEQCGISRAYLEREEKRLLKALEARRRRYAGGRQRKPATGRTVILVDDGIATGATVRAAILAIREENPKRIILAAPVAPPDSIQVLRPLVDDLVCLETPAAFRALSLHYADFEQVSDDEVIACLSAFGTGPDRAGYRDGHRDGDGDTNEDA